MKPKPKPRESAGVAGTSCAPPRHTDASLIKVAAGAAFAATLLVAESADAQEAKLVVFLHLAVKQRALQSALQDALPGVKVVAVGRVGDFERELQDAADAVLAIPAVLSNFKLNAKLRGTKAGSPDEKYALVGVDVSPEPTKVASVGALDLFGREGTNNFVKGLLDASPKVERVSKVEDLLPLLQMQRVESVLLPTRLVSELKSASKLNLVTKELTKPVGLPAVAVLTAGGEKIVAAVSKMSAATSKTLGVDSWR
jgi:hypothetical protein